VRGEKAGEKPAVAHRTVAVGFGLCVLLAFGFNDNGPIKIMLSLPEKCLR